MTAKKKTDVLADIRAGKIKPKSKKKGAKKKASKKKASKKATTKGLNRPIQDVVKDVLSADRKAQGGKKKRIAPRKSSGPAHYIMWVGSGSLDGGKRGYPGYPTVDSYVDEAKRMGVSKRLNFVPPAFTPGVTRVYLVHARLFETASRFLDVDTYVNRQAVPKISRIKAVRKVGNKVIAGEEPTSTMWNHISPIYNNDYTFSRLVNATGMSDPRDAIKDTCRKFVEALDNGKGVFGYFVCEKLEYILPTGATIPDKIQKLVDDGMCNVIHEADEVRLAVRPRGCGYRKPGGVYAVASHDASIKDKKGVLSTAGPLVVATAPVEVPGLDYYRGVRTLPDDLADVLELEMDLNATTEVKS